MNKFKKEIYELKTIKILTEEEKDIILEFTRCSFALFFSMGNKQPTTIKKMESLIFRHKKNLTMEQAVKDMLKNATLNPNLYKRIDKLLNTMQESSIKDNRYLTAQDNWDKAGKKECEIQLLIAYIQVSYSSLLKPIKDVAEHIGIAPDTIRQACRKNMIVAKRYKTTWLVDSSECEEYFS